MEISANKIQRERESRVEKEGLRPFPSLPSTSQKEGKKNIPLSINWNLRRYDYRPRFTRSRDLATLVTITKGATLFTVTVRDLLYLHSRNDQRGDLRSPTVGPRSQNEPGSQKCRWSIGIYLTEGSRLKVISTTKKL